MKLNVSVKDVMRKKIKAMNVNGSVKDAASIMKNCGIGSVVIIDKGKNVVGIVTTSDIVSKYVAGNKKTIKEIMSKNIFKIKPDDAIEKAAETMAKKHIEKLLVFDKGKIVGIISATDILRIEPGLHTVLFEMLKTKGSAFSKGQDTFFGVCESCGNYSDDLSEVGGVWICPECAEE